MPKSLTFPKSVQIFSSICIILVLLISSQPGLAFSQESTALSAAGDIGWKAGFSINGVNPGFVTAMATDGKNVYVSGYFSRAGDVSVNNIAMWNGVSWHPLGNGIDYPVYALAVDSRGRLYAGGQFDTVGGQSIHNIACWNGHDWEALGGGIGMGSVYALAVGPSGRVYAGGVFTNAGGEESKNIAMWDGVKWNSLAGGVSDEPWPPGSVNAITIDRSGFVYVAGAFESVGGKVANNIARWDGTEWSALGKGIDTHWLNTTVYALATDTRGNLYAGGRFSTAGGINVANIARWDGEIWSALGEGITVNGDVEAVKSIVTDGGIVYAGGGFASSGGIPVEGIARWNGKVWENINNGIWAGDYNGQHQINISGLGMDREGRLYVTGNFWVAGGNHANGVAAWDGVSWSGLGADNTIYGNISTMIPDHKGGVYIGGHFDSAFGKNANDVAYWNGSTWAALDGGITGYADPYPFDAVSALALDKDENLYAVGMFTQAGDNPANNVAKWNGNIWESLGEGIYGEVTAIAIDSQNHIYIGGMFTTASSQPANNIAEWTGTQWEALGSGLGSGGTVHLAVDSQDRLIAAGSFNTAGGVPVDGLARWDGQQWEVIGKGIIPQYPSFLQAIGDSIYLGRDQVWKLKDGTFEPVGDQVYCTFQCQASIGNLAIDHLGRMVVGGSFDKAGGVVANNIARWTGARWENLGSGVGDFVGGVNSVVFDGSENLFVSGFFNTAGGKLSLGFAQWNDPFSQWLPIVRN